MSPRIASAKESGKDLMQLAPEDVGLKPCGQKGRHGWMWGAARVLIKRGFDDEEIGHWIAEHLTRLPGPREIEVTIENARRKPLDESTPALWRPKASYNPDKLQSFAEQAAGFTAEDLKGKSPIAPDSVTPADFLRAISQQRERRLVFTDFYGQGEGLWTCPAEGVPHDPNALRKFIMPPMGNGVWFSVNPVDGIWRNLPRLVHPRNNPTGRTRRAEENLTGFPFILLESDEAPAGLWIAALARMPLPIVAIYESGDKSVHALVKTGARNKEEWEAEKRRIEFPLVTLGADSNAMTAVRLSRLPQCYRAEKRAWQRLLYLNPSPSGEAIINQPDRDEAAQTTQKERSNG